jgi:hypothetical protein
MAATGEFETGFMTLGGLFANARGDSQARDEMSRVSGLSRAK